MHTPRIYIAATLTAAVLFSLFLSIPTACSLARAQQATAQASDEIQRGITLYKQGDIKGAIKVLRSVTKQRKDDANAWYYLGVALNDDNDVRGAHKAFEVAVKLRPDFAGAHTGLAYTLLLANKLSEAMREGERALTLDKQDSVAHYVIGVVALREGASSKAANEADAALKIKPNMSEALLLKSQALLAAYRDNPKRVENESPAERQSRIENSSALLKAAAQCLENYLKLKPDATNASVWREQLETLLVYAQFDGKDRDGIGRTVFSQSEVTTKARIVSKTTPAYTEAARSAGVSGSIRLRLVLASDGTVKHILVLRSLSHGLTEQAIKAARTIKFIPAIKDGNSVSQFATVDFNFQVY